MRQRMRCAIILGLLLLALPALAQGDIILRAERVDASHFPDVQVDVTVRDQYGLPVSAAEATFTVSEDYSLQPRRITTITTTVNPDAPIAVVVVLDVSGSMGGRALSDAKTVALRFLDSLGERDRAAVIAFADALVLDGIDPAREQPFTGDVETVKALVKKLKVGDGTPLYDAAYKAVRWAGEQPAGTRAVLVLSDGWEETSTDGTGGSRMASEDSAIRLANIANVPVFTIGLGWHINDRYLRRLATETGGQYYVVTETICLPQVVRSPAEGQRSGLYLLAPETGGQYLGLPSSPKTRALAGGPTERLTNGDFESGFTSTPAGYVVGNGWSWFDNGGSVQVGFYDETWPPVIYDGEHAQLIELSTHNVGGSEPDRYAGIYQTVAVVPGETYELALHGMLRAVKDDPDRTKRSYRLQYGVDYAGGTDWRAVDNWVEIPWDTVYPRLSPGSIDSYSASITAASPRLTLYIRAWKKWGTTERELNVDLDGISLKGATPCAYHGAPSSDTLDDLFKHIADLLRQQIQITYQSCAPDDGLEHSVHVEVRVHDRVASDETTFQAPKGTAGSLCITPTPTPTNTPTPTSTSTPTPTSTSTPTPTSTSTPTPTPTNTPTPTPTSTPTVPAPCCPDLRLLLIATLGGLGLLMALGLAIYVTFFRRRDW